MYLLLKTVAFLLSLLPVSFFEWLAKVGSYFFFDILKVRRKLVMKNLTIALADAYQKDELVAIGRNSYRNFLLTIFESLRSLRHNISANFEAKDRENIEQALAKGQGVYILCFHLGNWEAMGSYVTRNIVPSHVFVKKVGGSGVNKFVEEMRQHNQFLWVKRQSKGDGMKALYQVLDQGEAIGFVMDQARPGEPRLPFFGTPAKTNTSFAAIWQRRNAPIVPVYVHRKSMGHHVIEFMPELELPKGPSTREEITMHSTLFNQVVEKAVRRYPDHYFWLHNRWK